MSKRRPTPPPEDPADTDVGAVAPEEEVLAARLPPAVQLAIRLAASSGMPMAVILLATTERVAADASHIQIRSGRKEYAVPIPGPWRHLVREVKRNDRSWVFETGGIPMVEGDAAAVVGLISRRLGMRKRWTAATLIAALARRVRRVELAPQPVVGEDAEPAGSRWDRMIARVNRAAEAIDTISTIGAQSGKTNAAWRNDWTRDE